MKLFGRLLLLCFCFCFFVSFAFAQKLPDYSNYVNDFAQIYSPAFVDQLNQDLSLFDSQTSVQIAVATIKSLEGLTIEDYSIKLADKWAVGKKNQDNGLLLLIAPNDKKVRIEVGYALGAVITDGRSGNIIDNYFLPEFKKGNYEKGTLDTITQIKSYITNSDQSPTPPPVKAPSESTLKIIFLIIFSGLPIYLLAYLSRSKEFYTGGIVGAIFGFLIGHLAFAIGLGIFGLILDFILSKNYKNLKSHNLPTGFRSTRGGFWSGGSSKGGGFGGFGGGRFGGGGASRGW